MSNYNLQHLSFQMKSFFRNLREKKMSTSFMQGCHFVRNVGTYQKFEKFCQKVRKMSEKLLSFSNVRKISGIFHDMLIRDIPYFMFCILFGMHYLVVVLFWNESTDKFQEPASFSMNIFRPCKEVFSKIAQAIYCPP